MNNTELENIINNLLNIKNFQDYVPNGLQVEGQVKVKRIVTGVTASQELLDAAIDKGADTILVHHGYFWKNEPVVIRDMKHKRLNTLLKNNINLYAYHLPLDAHPTLGNNAQLARLLEIKYLGNIEPLLPYGELKKSLNSVIFRQRLEKFLGRKVIHCGDISLGKIKKLAWCTGGGQGYIRQASEFGLDAFISGEISEQTTHIAREMGLHFYAAGHHATERYGIKALGEWLSKHYQFDVTFIDLPNPA